MSEKEEIESSEERGDNSGRTRREFLTASGGLILGTTLSGCAKRPGSIGASPVVTTSSARVIGANDRIGVGIIGAGMMGTGHVRDIVGPGPNAAGQERPALRDVSNVEVTAICDVYTPWRERALEMIGAPRSYVDYRELLADREVDCVIIATPEHWHYQMAIDALSAGLDVYLQKPMTRTHDEALRLRNAFRQSDRIFQLGTQSCQSPVWWRARELYRAGHLGKIVLSQTSYHRNSREGEWNYEIEDARPGVNLDWERWLGPLGPMEYDPEYFFRWRKYEKFSGGIITDLLPHRVHALQYVLGAQDVPRRVGCLGGIYVQKDRTVADTLVLTIDYGDSLMMVSGATCNERGLEDMIRGHEATLYIGDSAVRIAPERPFVDEMDPITSDVEPAQMSSNQVHMDEFFKSMRTRQQPTWDVESSYRIMVSIAMAEIAYRQQRTVEFDADQERVV